MVDKLNNDSPLSYHHKLDKIYKKDYVEAADIFKQASEQYTKSDNMFQRHEYQNVMKEAMNIMNQSASSIDSEIQRQKLLNQNSEIEADLEALDQDDSSTAKLQSDLEKARDSVK